jgi:hypothetical protein
MNEIIMYQKRFYSRIIDFTTVVNNKYFQYSSCLASGKADESAVIYWWDDTSVITVASKFKIVLRRKV